MNLSDLFLAEAVAVAEESRGELQSYASHHLSVLANDPDHYESRARAAYFLRKLGRYEDAISLLEEGVKRAKDAGPHRAYIDLLAECNRTEDAIAAARRALAIFPNDVLLQMKEALLLPVLYDSTEEMDRYRSRFTEGLERLSSGILRDAQEDQAGRGPAPRALAPTSLIKADQRQQALVALANHVNFYLAYQGRDDRDLQARYGALAHRIMAANFPQWAQPIEMPAAESDGRLRIGFVSSRFQDVSSIHFFLGWLRGLDRSRFSVEAWHVGKRADRVTEEVRGICDRFEHSAGDLEDICRSIRARDLHALVFIDVGLDPFMTQLAALRLARTQCMAWDHPVTSGLPTVDYAFSAELAEPEGAEAHYSEHLIRLPGIGICCPKPLIPTPLLRKTRRDFGLREDATVYLCCQSVFKFLPQNDRVPAEIAQRVPSAQFVFIAINAMAGRQLLRRLERTFAEHGLRATDHCVFLEKLNHLDYWNLNRVGDVFLDTIGWSSAVSAMDALACGVPVVTTEGSLMRGRQAAAILKQMGVTDTIAADQEAYVEVAASLSAAGFRTTIADRIKSRSGHLYGDPRSVRAMEDFLWDQGSGCKPA